MNGGFWICPRCGVVHGADPQPALTLERRLAGIDSKLAQLTSQEVLNMATVQQVQQQVTDLQDSVAKETTVTQSVLTLIQGLGGTIGSLQTQLADAIKANDPAAIQAVSDALMAVKSTLDQNTQTLADAVTANTPPPATP